MNATTHPQREELAAYLRGTLPEDRAAPMEEHLQACPACEEIIQGMEGLSDPLLQGLRRCQRLSDKLPSPSGRGAGGEGRMRSTAVKSENVGLIGPIVPARAEPAEERPPVDVPVAEGALGRPPMSAMPCSEPGPRGEARRMAAHPRKPYVLAGLVAALALLLLGIRYGRPVLTWAVGKADSTGEQEAGPGSSLAPGQGRREKIETRAATKAQEYQAAWAQRLGIPVEITNSIGMKLVLVPPGEFEMGSPQAWIDEQLGTSGGTDGHETDLRSESPRHHVRITQPFYLGACEVTQGEYQRVMGANPSEFPAAGNGKDQIAGDDRSRFPVERVSWNDAVEFCRRLTELPAEQAAGRSYGLPAEAQWEYACRAWSTGRYGFSPDGAPVCREADERTLLDYGWFHANARGATHPVGLKRANHWGLYDMHGNVAEWCQDWYDQDYYWKSPAADPPGPPRGSDHVHRGGSWDAPANECRCACRSHYALRGSDIGFRVSSPAGVPAAVER